MSGSVSKLKDWIGGTRGPGVPGAVTRDHTQIVTPLSVPLAPGGESFGSAGVISVGLVIEGPVVGLGPLVIAGAVHGDVRIKGKVLVLPSAWVEGSIDAASVEVHGHVAGEVVAREVLSLKAGGHVVGDVWCRELRVDGGGRLDGRCTMEVIEELELACLPSPPPFGVMSA